MSTFKASGYFFVLNEISHCQKALLPHQHSQVSTIIIVSTNLWRLSAQTSCMITTICSIMTYMINKSERENEEVIYISVENNVFYILHTLNFKVVQNDVGFFLMIIKVYDCYCVSKDLFSYFLTLVSQCSDAYDGLNKIYLFEFYFWQAWNE